jgi:hypothetical protein
MYGEIFNFGLVIIGKAIEYLLYFIYCFEELGNRGLGKNNGKYNLCSVSCCGNNKAVYVVSKLNPENILPENIESKTDKTVNKVNIVLKTPFRALENHKVVDDIGFYVLVKNILRRIDLISYYHCDKKLDIDFKGIIQDSKKIVKTISELSFYNWERIGSKTKKVIYMGGYIGNLEYYGDLTKMMPVIKLCEVLHIEKGCSFGKGKYTCNE